MRIVRYFLIISAACPWFSPAAGQTMDTIFKNMFRHFLVDELVATTPTIRAFTQSALEAERDLAPALNNLIASNIAAFPLPSTNAALSFDFTSGDPQALSENLGPLFAETAKTVGKGKINIGFNISHYGLSEFRSLPVEDMRVTFFAEDRSGDGRLGTGDLFFDAVLEAEYIQAFLDLHLDARTSVLFTTAGITHNLDVGFAIPLTQLRIDGVAKAVIQSTTFLTTGAAAHYFSGHSLDPELESFYPYDLTATGFGDASVRVKYSRAREGKGGMAALLDIRLPTGDKSSFLGTGAFGARLFWIFSKDFSLFSPHANIGFSYNAADFMSDELEVIIGFNQKMSRNVTFMFDVLADFALRADVTPLPHGVNRLTFQQQTFLPASFEQDVEFSNIPHARRDHIINASAGIKAAFFHNKLLLMGNALLALQNGGLRSNVIPQLGAAFVF